MLNLVISSSSQSDQVSTYFIIHSQERASRIRYQAGQRIHHFVLMAQFSGEIYTNQLACSSHKLAARQNSNAQIEMSHRVLCTNVSFRCCCCCWNGQTDRISGPIVELSIASGSEKVRERERATTCAQTHAEQASKPNLTTTTTTTQHKQQQKGDEPTTNVKIRPLLVLRMETIMFQSSQRAGRQTRRQTGWQQQWLEFLAAQSKSGSSIEISRAEWIQVDILFSSNSISQLN